MVFNGRGTPAPEVPSDQLIKLFLTITPGRCNAKILGKGGECFFNAKSHFLLWFGVMRSDTRA